jgi:hypothetical protein
MESCPHKDAKEDTPIASEPASQSVKEPGPQVETPGLTRQVVVIEAPRSRYSPKAAADVLQLLRAIDRRLTGQQIAEELSARKIYWSSSLLDHTLSEMRRRADLSNARDARGNGYGLPEWDDEDNDGKS